jgi:hypothetical protein
LTLNDLRRPERESLGTAGVMGQGIFSLDRIVMAGATQALLACKLCARLREAARTLALNLFLLHTRSATLPTPTAKPAPGVLPGVEIHAGGDASGRCLTRSGTGR